MKVLGRSRRPSSFTVLVFTMVALVLSAASESRPEACRLPPEHVGLTFPVNQVQQEWACRLEAVVANYTTANKVGPIRTALAEAVYTYFLDRPPTAAALINRLDLGLYKSEARGPGRWWGDDGEGTQGLVHLVYQDPRSRIYFLEGSHHSRLLPNITGKAVVFVRMTPVKDAEGRDAVDTTLVSYTRVDNRVLSGLLSLLRPLIGSSVTRKLIKGVETVNRLGLEMRHHPERVIFEAMDPPALPTEDVAFLREALMETHQSGKARSQSPGSR
ncbi:MAG TPA: hypothetical protein VFS39_02690 [Nitrospira sp.]|nr:hypothetical protein [Nitrospira sp.]